MKKNKKILYFLFCFLIYVGLLSAIIISNQKTAKAVEMVSPENLRKAIEKTHDEREKEALQKLLIASEAAEKWTAAGTVNSDATEVKYEALNALSNTSLPQEEKSRLSAAVNAAQGAMDSATLTERTIDNAYTAALYYYNVLKAEPMGTLLEIDIHNAQIAAQAAGIHLIDERLNRSVDEAYSSYEKAYAALHETAANDWRAAVKYDYEIQEYLKKDISPYSEIISDLAVDEFNIASTVMRGRPLRQPTIPYTTPSAIEQPKTFTPSMYLPFLKGKKNITLGDYIYALYLFAFSIAGILVVVVLVVAGVIYLSSGGNPNRMATAKSMIISALTGLVLLFCSWLILRIINPDLLRKDLPELPATGTVENVTNPTRGR